MELVFIHVDLLILLISLQIKVAVEEVLARNEPMASLDKVTIESCGKSRIPLNGFVSDLHQANLRKLYRELSNGDLQ